MATKRAESATKSRQVKDLSKRPLIEILYRDFARDLFERSCIETLHRDLLQRSSQGVSYIDLAKRAPIESLYGDL